MNWNRKNWIPFQRARRWLKGMRNWNRLGYQNYHTNWLTDQTWRKKFPIKKSSHENNSEIFATLKYLHKYQEFPTTEKKWEYLMERLWIFQIHKHKSNQRASMRSNPNAKEKGKQDHKTKSRSGLNHNNGHLHIQGPLTVTCMVLTT